MSAMRLRQVALVAQDLEGAAQQLGTVLGVSGGYHDPGIIKFGLDNWVAPIGDTFLEVVSPVEEGTTAGRYLDRRGGDGGYMVIFQTRDLDAAVERIEAHEARIVWEGEAEHDGERTAGRHVHPRDCGGAIVSVDQAWPDEAWVWAGPGWRDRPADHAARIVAVDVQSSDPAAMASRWAQLLGSSAERFSVDGREGWQMALRSEVWPDGGRVRFVGDRDGRGAGVSGLEFEVNDLRTVRTALDSLGVAANSSQFGVAAEMVGVETRFVVGGQQ